MILPTWHIPQRQKKHAGNSLSQHTVYSGQGNVIHHILSTALATSPGTSTLHRLCISLPRLAFTIPYLFQLSTCNASNNTVSHWNTAAKLRMAESNSTLPTCSHPPMPTALSVPMQCPSTITKPGKQKSTLHHNPDLLAHLPHKPEQRNTKL